MHIQKLEYMYIATITLHASLCTLFCNTGPNEDNFRKLANSVWFHYTEKYPDFKKTCYKLQLTLILDHNVIINKVLITLYCLILGMPYFLHIVVLLMLPFKKCMKDFCFVLHICMAFLEEHRIPFWMPIV